MGVLSRAFPLSVGEEELLVLIIKGSEFWILYFECSWLSSIVVKNILTEHFADVYNVIRGV